MFINYNKLADKLMERIKKDDKLMGKVVLLMVEKTKDVESEVREDFKNKCKEALIKMEKARVLESLAGIDYIAEIKADVSRDIKKKIDDTINDIFEV